MSGPAIRYARTSDARRIAYCVAGEGPALVWLPLVFSHVQIMERAQRPLLKELRERFRVVHYDSRGQGMSSRGLAPDHTMAHWQLDLESVMDALGIGQAVLLASCHSGHVAVRYALDNPERVAALVLVACCVRQCEWGPAALWERLPFENWDLFLTTMVPSGTPPERYGAVLDSLRSMITPEEYRVFDAVVVASTVEEELPDLQVPTLVVHPRNYTMLRPEQGAEFAALIPGARFLLIGGPEDSMTGDNGQLLDVIDDFLGDLLPERGNARVPRGGGASLPEHLTRRELDVLRLIASGSNREIADQLVISVRTVERHITNLYGKIGARGRADATAFFLQHELV